MPRSATNQIGIESFWAIVKRVIMGTFQKLSKKHLQRYVDQFVWRHDRRAVPALDKMEAATASMAGKTLHYAELVKEVEWSAERKTPADHTEASKPSSKREVPQCDRKASKLRNNGEVVHRNLFSS